MIGTNSGTIASGPAKQRASERVCELRGAAPSAPMAESSRAPCSTLVPLCTSAMPTIRFSKEEAAEHDDDVATEVGTS